MINGFLLGVSLCELIIDIFWSKKYYKLKEEFENYKKECEK